MYEPRSQSINWIRNVAELQRRRRHRFHFPIHAITLPSYLSFRLQFALSVGRIHSFHAIKLSVEWNIRYNLHAMNNLQFRRPALPTASFTHHWLVCLRETVCTGYWKVKSRCDNVDEHSKQNTAVNEHSSQAVYCLFTSSSQRTLSAYAVWAAWSFSGKLPDRQNGTQMESYPNSVNLLTDY